MIKFLTLNNDSTRLSNFILNGSNNKYRGNENIINGSDNEIYGDGNIINGQGNKIFGVGNILNDPNNTIIFNGYILPEFTCLCCNKIKHLKSARGNINGENSIIQNKKFMTKQTNIPIFWKFI